MISVVRTITATIINNNTANNKNMNNIQIYSYTVPTLPVLDLSSTGITDSNHIIYNGVTSLAILCIFCCLCVGTDSL